MQWKLRYKWKFTISSSYKPIITLLGFPGGSVGEESAFNAGSMPRPGRCPGGGHSNPLQYSCLENPMDRGPRWYTVHGVAKHWTWLNQLSMCMHTTLLLQCLLIKELWRDFPGSLGFPDSSVGKESACNAGDPGLIPGLGRSTREGLGYPHQYSWASFVAQLVKNPPAIYGTWVQSLEWEEPLEERTATHSSILASRIPWTV